MSVASIERGRAVVVKLGGEVVRGKHLAAIGHDLAEIAKTRPVLVVHGGGPQATELQKKLGQAPNIVAGRRITDDATLDVMKMTVAGQVNVDLCRALVGAGARPVGLSGASSCVITAKKRPPRVVDGGGPDPIDFGHVGDVTGLGEHLLGRLVGQQNQHQLGGAPAAEVFSQKGSRGIDQTAFDARLGDHEFALPEKPGGCAVRLTGFGIHPQSH